ncbi:MAG TPA: hypothetical protein V6D10_01425 [Trichocoleus sp.]|jgi:hypothetical protein
MIFVHMMDFYKFQRLCQFSLAQQQDGHIERAYVDTPWPDRATPQESAIGFSFDTTCNIWKFQKVTDRLLLA